MAHFLSLLLLILTTGILIRDVKATFCSSDNDCFHFEHCCKGNCTSKRLECEHICSSDRECSSSNRCVLGLCVNCTEQFSCDDKSCLNDSHCPGTHSCEEKVCSLKRGNDLTAEMLPFIIFIAALSVSLLIVCYNDYILERLGHRGCLECLGNRICNCSLFLKLWMWRHQRLQQRQRCGVDMTPPCPVEVRFDSRIVNPSNSFNEKQETGLFKCLGSLKSRLMFWRGLNDCTQSNSRSNESNVVSNTRMVSSVVLLNDFMNTNEADTETSSTSERTLSDTINTSGTSDRSSVSLQDRNKDYKRSIQEQAANVKSGEASNCENMDVNVNTPTNPLTSISTASHFVTIV